MQIKNTIMLITGAASGLGAASAQHLISLGAKVALLDIDKLAVEAKAQAIGGVGIECDVTNEASVLSALHQVRQAYGVARVCINFAGILGAGKVLGREEPMALDYFKRVLDVDLTGTFNVMRLAIDAMLQLPSSLETDERGVVINIASIAAFDGQIGQVAYSAAKAGVVGMTLPVAREMAEHNIRVACIAPGVFSTPMLENAPEKVRAGLLANTVFPKRFGQPSEIAAFIEHIITNPMVNGSVMRLDGAIRMPPR